MPKQYMDMGHVAPGDGYSVRKADGDISVAVKTVKRSGGHDAMVQRIIGVWLDMPEAYRAVGVGWYPKAHRFALELSEVYDITLWQACQVIAAISPQNPWEGDGKKIGNKACALLLIKTWREDGTDAALALKGWGFNPAFVVKALAVLNGEPVSWKDAPKTYRFALLIFNPDLLDVAVIDSHSSRVATGNIGNRYHVVSTSAYPHIEKAYTVAADLLGIPASILQAGTWQYASDGLLW